MDPCSGVSSDPRVSLALVPCMHHSTGPFSLALLVRLSFGTCPKEMEQAGFGLRSICQSSLVGLQSRYKVPVLTPCSGSLSWIPPATGLNFSVWALVCFIFNYVIHQRNLDWHKKYNMILSAGLDAGTALGVLVIFFGVVYWGFTEGFSWWGTEVYKQGCDWNACPYQTLAPGERFGPDTWH
jgi:hypothetical protein